MTINNLIGWKKFIRDMVQAYERRPPKKHYTAAMLGLESASFGYGNKTLNVRVTINGLQTLQRETRMDGSVEERNRPDEFSQGPISPVPE